MFGEGDLRGCGGFIRVSRGRGGSRGSSPVHGGGWELIRVHRLGSLGAKRSRFFALTPSPSPTLWERGAGAHSGAPCCAFSLETRGVGAHGGAPCCAFPWRRGV